jgi:hypothetical protein
MKVSSTKSRLLLEQLKIEKEIKREDILNDLNYAVTKYKQFTEELDAFKPKGEKQVDELMIKYLTDNKEIQRLTKARAEAELAFHDADTALTVHLRTLSLS